jgi:hypothetical protein
MASLSPLDFIVEDVENCAFSSDKHATVVAKEIYGHYGVVAHNHTPMFPLLQFITTRRQQRKQIDATLSVHR